MTDGHDEVRTDEDVHLSELDLLDVIQVAGGAQHDEQRVAVAIQLRPLMTQERVLRSEWMKPELGDDLAHLGLRGPVQPDPGDAAALVNGLETLGETRRIRRAFSVDVHREIDEGHAGPPFLRRRARGIRAHSR